MLNLYRPDVMERLLQEDAVLVTVASTEGSVPREAGTWMMVFAGDVAGTIGGGQLEFQAIAQARLGLQPGAPAMPADPVRYPLGPSLGQCCGGVMYLRYERVGAAQVPVLASELAAARSPVALFGGGHVGHALVQVLARLPHTITWVDSRDEIFPQGLPPQVRCEHSEPVQSAVAGLVPGSQVLVMSFSHAEDLDIVSACLRRQRECADLPFIGLIGSRTKWASFRQRLEQRGFSPAELAQVTCPIGLPGLRGKEPEVIAVSVAAQLLMRRFPPAQAA